jgi:autotransporter translocation and assembly factor TamB
VKKRLFYITAALVLLVVGINFVARGDYISGKVRDFILEKAQEKLGYELGMDRLVFNFFPAYVVLEKPYVKGWDPDDKRMVIRAENVRAYFSLAALVNKKVMISRIQVEGAKLHIIRRQDGSLNIDGLRGKLKSGEPGHGKQSDVDVKEIVLINSGIRYDDNTNGLAVITNDAGIDLRLLDDGYRLSCNITDILATHTGTPPVSMDIKGDVVYRGDRLNIASLGVYSKGSSITGSGTVVLAEHPQLDLKLNGRIGLALLSSLAILDGPASGTLGVKGVVSGVYPDLTGSGRLSLDKAVYRGVEVARLQSGLVFEGGALSFNDIKGDIYDGTVNGSARLDMSGDKPRYTASARFKDVLSGRFTEPDERLRFIPWYTASGVFNAEGYISDLPDLKASGSVMLERYDEPHSSPEASTDIAVVRRLEAEYAIDGRKVRIISGLAEAAHTKLDFKGTVGFDGETDIALSGSSSDIQDISSMLGYDDMDGELDVTGRMTGNILSPAIKGKARFSNVYAGGTAFPSAFGDVELSGWRLKFSDFVIRPEQGSFNLNGSIFFQGEHASFYEPYFDASLAVNGVDARKIVAIFYKDIPLDLNATGNMAFKGNTIDFEGRAHLETGAGGVYGQKVDKGEVWAELTRHEISFPKVIAVRDRDIVTGSGRIGFDGTFDAKASSARVQLENFDLLMGTGVPAKGSVSVSVTGSGSFGDPVINARISAYTLFLKDVDLGEASLDVEINKGRLSGKGSFLDDKVLLDGFLELDSPYNWKGRLAFKEGRFEPFVKLVYKDLPEGVSFVSTGVLDAHGSVDKPENDSASLRFMDVKATLFGRELKNVGDISMTYGAQGLEVDSLELSGDGVSLKVNGRADVDKGYDLKVEAGFDMDGLREVLQDSVEFIDGFCELGLNVSGPLDGPVVTGTARVSGGGVKFKDFPQRFEDISGVISLDGKSFEVKTFKAKFGGGTLNVKGRGGLKGLTPDNYSFDISASDVRLKYPENLASTINAKLFLEGVDDKVSLAGDVSVIKALYTERIEWKSWLLKLKKKPAETPEASRSALDDVALNVHITGQQTLKIENNVAKIPVTADLYVRGTIGKPILIGRLEAEGGQVYFRNNAFKLASAVVEFADPTRLNPIIDLQAETKVREYTIQLTLSGSLDRIGISLLSDPPLEEADIITLMTLGRTTEGLVGHEAAITTGEAASFVTGQIQDAVEERVRRLTGFDRFQIDPYLTSTGTSSGPRLTVGKSLFSDKLYITYSSNLGTSEDQFIRLEYIINKNLSLVGERDEMGRFGGDIKLRFNFK